MPISQLTTFQNQGFVPTVWVIEHWQDLLPTLCQLSNFRVLGKGSNTLINPEESIPPLVQLSPKLTLPEIHGHQLKVGAGTPVNVVMRLLEQHGLTGLEFSAGVPASVGGMVTMNFGCWGQEIQHFVDQVRLISGTGEDFWLSGKELDFGYRYSRIQSENWVVAEAIFTLQPDTPTTIKTRIRSAIDTRLAKQPLRDKTFGSVFKNPPGHSAGALIEQVGLKGYEADGVKFSEKHANFMVNLGSGSYQAAHQLIRLAQLKVKTQFNIELELEVKELP